MSTLSRRDFLKISASALGGAILATAHPRNDFQQNIAAKPNVIVLVLDAMSAMHLSLLGYVRKTTPNLEKIADRAIVYHNHYSGGSFTTPGTASMLTGLYPWTHRAFGLGGMIDRTLVNLNIFELLGGAYYRSGYTQNRLCNILLEQFQSGLDEKLPVSAFSFQRGLVLSEDNLPRDPLMASFVYQEILGENGGSSPSLTLGYANLVRAIASRGKKSDEYPLGVPNNNYEKFTLEGLLAGLATTYSQLSKDHVPFFAYGHLFPPHHPYCPKKKFIKELLNDGLIFPSKPPHPLAESYVSSRDLTLERLLYDAYIADLDQELGRFVQELDDSGVLDSTYLIITSDHGELFERSQEGHSSALLYEGVIKIPLIILVPGQLRRKDIYAPTSNVDLVPTILSLAGREIPTQLEGRVLPGLGGTEDQARPIYTIFSSENSSFLPLEKLVAASVKESYKIIYYRGYPAGYHEKFELYNLSDDPNEMNDLAATEPAAAKRIKDELLNSLDTAERLHQERHGGRN